MPLKNLFHTQVAQCGGRTGENRGEGQEPGEKPGGLQKNRGTTGGAQGRTGGEPGAVVSVYPRKQVLLAEEPGENRGGGEEPGENRGRGGGEPGGGRREAYLRQKLAFSQHIWSTPQFW